jgi:hypothetical protein
MLTEAAVGGIYSVLKSKAQVTTAEYGSAYTLLGPLNKNSVWRRQHQTGCSANEH